MKKWRVILKRTSDNIVLNGNCRIVEAETEEEAITQALLKRSLGSAHVAHRSEKRIDIKYTDQAKYFDDSYYIVVEI